MGGSISFRYENTFGEKVGREPNLGKETQGCLDFKKMEVGGEVRDPKKDKVLSAWLGIIVYLLYKP